MADEHRATAVAQRIIGRLGLQFGRPGRSRGTVILAAPAGDLHTLPVAMVADLLRWRRFDVFELGANTPADALAQAVSGADRLVAVGIAATTSGLDARGHSVGGGRAVDGDQAPPSFSGGAPSALRRTLENWGPTIWTGRDGIERRRGRRRHVAKTGPSGRSHMPRSDAMKSPVRRDSRMPSTVSSKSQWLGAFLGLAT